MPQPSPPVSNKPLTVRNLGRDLGPAAALGLVSLGALASAYLQPFSGGDQYLVVAPPSWSLARTINLVARADGRIVRAGRYDNMLFAASSRSDFGPALRAAGAWFVIATPATWGCDGGAVPGGRA